MRRVSLFRYGSHLKYSLEGWGRHNLHTTSVSLRRAPGQAWPERFCRRGWNYKDGGVKPLRTSAQMAALRNRVL